MSLAHLIKKGSLRGISTATPATFATHDPFGPSAVATVATVAVAKAPDTAAIDSALDPDQWCWPHTVAMNTREIDTFTARLTLFTDKGLGLDDAEEQADKLVRRDREKNDRHLCLECTNLTGQSGAAWRCKDWRRAGIALKAGDAQLSPALLLQLQRCEGFKAHVWGVKHVQGVLDILQNTRTSFLDR